MQSNSEATARVNEPPPLTAPTGLGPIDMADSDSIPTKAPRNTLEIAWAAGFLEGEGSFGYWGSPCVTAAQVQGEPIDRLVRLFGGRVTQRKTNGFSDRFIWVWAPSARRSVEIMMTLFVLMSPKRKNEIANALRKWMDGRLLKTHGNLVCGRGHALVGHNAVRVGKYTKCRECKNAGKRRLRKIRRGSEVEFRGKVYGV